MKVRFQADSDPNHIIVLAVVPPGEVLALDWQRDIDLGARRIHVKHQVQDGRLTWLKDDESRVVPILNPLAPILAA